MKLVEIHEERRRELGAEPSSPPSTPSLTSARFVKCTTPSHSTLPTRAPPHEAAPSHPTPFHLLLVCPASSPPHSPHTAAEGV
jgi:hypothetical protein